MGKGRGLARVLIVSLLGLLPVAAAQQQPTPQDLERLKQFVPIGLRSIPSESMLPNLMVGDRAVIVANDRQPVRGQVVIFQHPNSDRVMVSRIIGLPGDRIQMKRGQLILNGETVEKTLVRQVKYLSQTSGYVITASEYREQLPGEETPHLIHEFSDSESLDETPEFLVPDAHLFVMGDNRDNSEDSRAPSGHRAMVMSNPEGWRYRSTYLPADTRDDAIGFVPAANLMGRAATVIYTMNWCGLDDETRARGAECLFSRIGWPL